MKQKPPPKELPAGKTKDVAEVFGPNEPEETEGKNGPIWYVLYEVPGKDVEQRTQGFVYMSQTAPRREWAFAQSKSHARMIADRAHKDGFRLIDLVKGSKTHYRNKAKNLRGII